MVAGSSLWYFAPPDAETPDHIIFQCPTARAFWEHIGLPAQNSPACRELWRLPRPPSVPEEHFTEFIFLCCWRLWKHRNKVVFEAETPSLSRLLRGCREEARVWGACLPDGSKHIVDSWCMIWSPICIVSHRNAVTVVVGPRQVVGLVRRDRFAAARGGSAAEQASDSANDGEALSREYATPSLDSGEAYQLTLASRKDNQISASSSPDFTPHGTTQRGEACQGPAGLPGQLRILGKAPIHATAPAAVDDAELDRLKAKLRHICGTLLAVKDWVHVVEDATGAAAEARLIHGGSVDDGEAGPWWRSLFRSHHHAGQLGEKTASAWKRAGRSVGKRSGEDKICDAGAMSRGKHDTAGRLHHNAQARPPLAGPKACPHLQDPRLPTLSSSTVGEKLHAEGGEGQKGNSGSEELDTDGGRCWVSATGMASEW
nr:unnamed protein product [Digitaria exilis]